MLRALAAAILACLLMVAVMPVAGIAAEATELSITTPSHVEIGVSTAFQFELPRDAAAVDGRLFFDTSAAELVGLAPLGGGVAFMPEAVPGGMAFGAYDLSPTRGRTVVRVVLAPLKEGQLDLNLIVDAAADKAGRKLKLADRSEAGTLRVSGSMRALTAPQPTARQAPLRASGPTRSLSGRPIIGKPDLDMVRAGWELARARDSVCDPQLADYADANGDGCIDIVDVQAVFAARGKTGRANQAAPTSIASPLATNAINTRFTASIGGPMFEPAVTMDASTGPTFVVDSTADTADATVGDGTCADSLNRCTMRAAIQEANNWPGENRIEFALSGSAPFTIQITTTPLPLINDRSGGLTIDGYSQAGSSPNSAVFGSDAVLRILVRGPGTTASARNPLRITSPDNVVRGLAFNNFNRAIVLDGPDATNNKIIGDWLGFNTDGSVASSSAGYDILINSGASNNIIGTPLLADRNVIGRATTGIMHYGAGTSGNVVQNNLFCASPTGSNTSTASCSSAVDHDHGPKHGLVGGAGINERNIVGRTILNGIEYSHGWNPSGPEGATDDTWQVAFNSCIGNWVGFRHNGAYDSAFRSGQNSPGSADNGNGINVYDGSRHNLVEGNYVASVYDGIQTMSSNATDNTIRNNTIGVSPLGQAAPLTGWGISVRESTRTHLIEGNIIRNAQLGGIGLRQADVRYIKLTRNIVSDTSGPAIYLEPYANNPSSGANDLLGAPAITEATTLHVSGTGVGGASVEVYRADRPAGQSGLPVEFIGSTTVSAAGTWTLNAPIGLGQRATALQITPNQNTSPLSNNVTVVFEAAPPPPVADFSWGQHAASLTVDFTDTSTGSPFTWSWDFGDGTTSTQQSPSKTYAAAGSYEVSLTASNAGGSDTRMQTITVVSTPPPAGGIVAADAFSRTVNGTWGSADLGGAYTLQGTAANYIVGSGVGSIVVPSAGTTRSALLGGVSQTDVDMTFRVRANKVASGATSFVYAVARRNSGSGSEYRPRILLNANGTISAHASILLNGSESALGSAVVVPGLTQAANSFIWVRAQVFGTSPTTIRVKAWADGQSEPAAWAYSTTNSVAGLQAAGGVGLRVYIGGGANNAPLTFGFDDFLVAGFPPPPPVADFSSSQVPSSLSVEFTDTSTGAPTSWSWDFGDGTSSVQHNPTKTYSSEGAYTVTLTAGNAGGSDVKSKSINVQALPVAPLYAEDAFSRTIDGAWGNADFGGTYTIQGTAANYSVGSGTGSIVVPVSGNTRSAILAGVSQRDVDITYRVGADKVAAGARSFIYTVARRDSGGNSEYRPRILLNTDGTVSAHASRLLGGSESALGSAVVVPGLAQAADTFIWVRAQVMGQNPTTIRVKVWADVNPEPASWIFTTTDSSAALQVAGGAGIRVSTSAATSNSPVTFRFDDLEIVGEPVVPPPPPPAPTADFLSVRQPGGLTVDFTDTSTGSPTEWSWDFGDGTTSTQQSPSKTYPAAGSYEVSLTASNAGGSDSATKTVDVEPAGGGATYVADAFSRTISDGWGSAPTGGAYTLQGTAANYIVGSGVGSIVVPSAGTTRSALLGGVSQTDVDMTFRVRANKVASGATSFVYAVARRNSGSGSEYRPRILLNANGTISAHASILLNGSESALGSAVVVPGLTQAANSFIWVRAQVFGTSPTTIRVKAWADGQSEPAAWAYSTTNSVAGLQAAGGVGLRVYIGGGANNAPLTFGFDDFLVTSTN